MDLYAQNILDHYKEPHNHGRLAHPTISQREANHSCGDILELDLEIQDDKITDLKFTGQGCAISQAAMSILSDELIGQTTQHAWDLNRENVYELLGIEISTRRSKCALLSLLAVKNALANLKNEPQVQWSDLMAE